MALPHKNADGDASAGVSYVMPVLAEADHIAASVHALFEQDYDGPVEIVVAVGPSDDGTEEILADLARHDPRVRVIPNPAGSTPVGLNLAIRASQHPVVIRVDAHSELPADYTRIAVETIERTDASNVGGVMAAEGRTPFERAVASAYGSRVGLGGSKHHVGGPEGPAETVYLGVFQREHLLRLGLFDEGIRRGQDWELNRRIRSSGGVVWFTPDLTVTYRPRSSLRRLATQFYSTGVWRGELARRFSIASNPRYAAPPALVVLTALSLLAGVIGLVVTGLTGRAAWPLLAFLAVPAVYLLSVIVASVVVIRPAGPRSVLWGFLVLPCIHFSWGYGFLLGWLRLARDIATVNGR